MNRAAIIGAAMLGLGGVVYWRYLVDQVDQTETVPEDVASQPEPTIFEDAMSQVSNITISAPGVVNDPQVRAFLWLIRTGEGTTGANGYRTLFGGRLFTEMNDHPRLVISLSGYRSTAAGAYQFLTGTWDEMASKYDLIDFSPASQDIAAVGLIKRRGALADVMAGRFRAAIDKCNKEWASLPGSPYGQPTLSYGKAQDVLAAAGAYFLGGSIA
jgi:muramidase (phage lysozyme)